MQTKLVSRQEEWRRVSCKLYSRIVLSSQNCCSSNAAYVYVHNQLQDARYSAYIWDLR